MTGHPVCPECVQDKHGNCDGTAWDVEGDDRTICHCPSSEHVDDK